MSNRSCHQPPHLGNLVVTLCTDEQQFLSMRAPWNLIADHVPWPRAFASHEWFEAAWQWKRQNATLWILCCWRDGQLVAVLPLMREVAVVRSVALRQLAFLTVPDTQFCDVLCLPECVRPACEALSDEIRARTDEWDVIRLRYLSTDAAVRLHLVQFLQRQKTSMRCVNGPPNPYIDLDATWHSFYSARGRRLKKANNLAKNRLDAAGRVSVLHMRSADGHPREELLRFCDWCVTISSRSWKAKIATSLDHSGPNAFVQRLSSLAERRGWLSIWVLLLNEAPIAMEYQLIADRTIFALRSDFDEKYESLSPGSHLSRVLLESQFNSGMRRYYMGPGNNAYKYRWTDSVEPMHELVIYGRSSKGRALGLWELYVRPPLRRLIQRARNFRALSASAKRTTQSTLDS